MGTPKDGWAGSMNRWLSPAEACPNAFGGWFEHIRGFEKLARDSNGPDGQRVLIVESGQAWA